MGGHGILCPPSEKVGGHARGGWAVPDEAFRRPEAQLFEGPHLFNKHQCLMVSP